MVREEGVGRAYGSHSARSLRLLHDWRHLIYGNTYDSKLNHPLSRFQIVGIVDQSCVPMTQGFFRFPKLFQQRGARTSCQGISRTIGQPRLQQGHPLDL